MAIYLIYKVSLLLRSGMEKGALGFSSQVPKNLYSVGIDQTCPVMHANALLMQYHYFYWNIAIFHYYFLLMIYCNIALLFFGKCII